MNNVERAVSCFNDGFSCSQAVLATYAELFGLDRDRALKVASAFGGGMGHLGETCGAVTGAFMVIGLKCGQTDADDKETKKKTYRLVKAFAEKFKARNGSISCTELLGCDLSTPEGMKRAKEQNLFTTLCPTFVRDATELLEELL
ncbi:MAG TPA: C-GCAxxG-C-C family protein [Desulfobacteria bacterium]|nr:C-GCAxxG-C-C family protein [Desulfobacteria bacterium]